MKALKVLVIIVVVALLGLELTVHVLSKKAGEQFAQYRAQFEAEMGRLEPKVLADRTLFESANKGKPLLRSLGPFPGEDAGSILNANLRWETTQNKEANLQSPLNLPAETEKQLLRQSPNEWTDSQSTLAGSLDFSWLKRLLSTDHWRLASPNEGPVSIFSLLTYPQPRYETLLAWTKLRWLVAKRKQDYLDASKEIQHLAELLFTTESLQAGMTGWAILSIERSVYDGWSAAQPELAKTGWSPVSRDELTKLKRYLWASPSLMSLANSQQLRDRYYNEAFIGLCIGLNEAAFQYALAKAHQLPEARADLAWFEKVLMQDTRCELVWPRKVWATTKVFNAIAGLPLITFKNATLDYGTAFMIAPELQQYLGYYTLLVSFPDFMKLYREGQ